MNGSPNECVNAWLCGSLDDIKKAGWLDGLMGNENVKAWTEKWRLEI